MIKYLIHRPVAVTMILIALVVIGIVGIKNIKITDIHELAAVTMTSYDPQFAASVQKGDLLVGGRSLLAAFSGGDVWKGDLLFMLAASSWATYSVLARRHAVDAVQATIAITAFACMVYLPSYALLVWLGAVTSHLAQAPWSEIAFQMLFQGGGSVVVSGIGFTRMIQHYGPVRSTMITALVPGLSAIGAVVFLDEPMHWNLVAGLLLVTAGILVGVLRKSQAPAAAAKAAS